MYCVVLSSSWTFLRPWAVGFPGGSAGEDSACNAGYLGSIPGLGRFPGEGKVYPLQYSGQENSMDCIVHGVVKSRTRLSNVHMHSQRALTSNPLPSWLWVRLWSFLHVFTVEPKLRSQAHRHLKKALLRVKAQPTKQVHLQSFLMSCARTFLWPKHITWQT